MLLNLFALVTLAVVGSVAPLPGANALSVEAHNFVRNGQGHAHAARHHAVLNKRQSGTSRPRRCKARPTESSLSSSSSVSSSTGTSKPQGSATGSPVNPTSTSKTEGAPTPAPTSSKPAATSANPPATSAVVSVPPPTQGGGGGYNSKKACITYVGNVDVTRLTSGSDNVGCVINWSSWKPEWMKAGSQFMNEHPGAAFVPMFHSPGHASDFKKNVVAGFSNFVLGFNEPNQVGQAEMSPGHAIQLWWEYMQPLKSQGYQLISPACTNAPSGLQWMKEFVNGCNGCNIDGIATHFYGTDANALIAHLTQYHDTFNRELWLTEYACQDFSGRNAQCSPDKTWAFMETTLSFMESQPWVKHHAWFGALQHENLGGVDPVNRLIDNNSNATPLGRKYLGI